jgi:hypothetical protein
LIVKQGQQYSLASKSGRIKSFNILKALKDISFLKFSFIYSTNIYPCHCVLFTVLGAVDIKVPKGRDDPVVKNLPKNK